MDNLYGTPIVWTTMAGSIILASRCVFVCQFVCHELYDTCHELNNLKIDLQSIWSTYAMDDDGRRNNTGKCSS